MHPLHQHPLPGLDARRLRALEAAGVSHLEDLVAAGADRLASLTQFDAKTCRALVRLAEGALDRETSSVIPLVDPTAGASRLSRGLDAARRLEKTHALIRKARSSWLPEDPRSGWRRRVRRARKQARRLEEHLTSLQQTLLAEGVSVAGDGHLRGLLEDLEAQLGACLQSRPCRRHFKQLARLLRDGRKRLAI